jgi:hypothetical protein
VIISEVFQRFDRQGRRYYLFSVRGDPRTYLYFVRTEGAPLRSLVFGDGFLAAVSELLEDEGSCIECGLGTRIEGGVSLDCDRRVECGMRVDQADQVLQGLCSLIPEDERFFVPFAKGREPTA